MSSRTIGARCCPGTWTAPRRRWTSSRQVTVRPGGLSAGWAELEPPLVDALFTPLPALGPASRMLGRLGIGGTLRMARQALLPVRRFGEELFEGEGGTILLAGNALHADLPPEGAGSGVYGWLLAMLGQHHGFPVPVGGAGKLAEALVRRLAARGGELRLESPVAGIEIRGRRAVGVRLASGEKIAARRAVLADVAAPILFEELVGESRLPAKFTEDLHRFQWDAPTLKVDWALKVPIPWSAEGAWGAGTVHLGVDLDGLTCYAADLATKQVPQAPFILLGQMTTADPSRSPAGTESAWAYTHLPHGVEFDDELIDAHVRRIEAVVERHAPGFGELIAGRYVQSPARLQEENPSLVHGAVNGGTANCTSSWSSVRCPASAAPTHRSTGCSWPARRLIPVAVCTVRAARTPPAPHWPGPVPWVRPGVE